MMYRVKYYRAFYEFCSRGGGVYIINPLFSVGRFIYYLTPLKKVICP